MAEQSPLDALRSVLAGARPYNESREGKGAPPVNPG